MANVQYIIPASARGDTSAFTVPRDEDGGENVSSFQVETQSLGESQDSYVHITNKWDVDVDITYQGSHFRDKEFQNPVDDGVPITVAANETDFFDVVTSHTYVGVKVEPSATPTNGELTITIQGRRS